MGDRAGSTPWVVRIGNEELVIRKRYEVISIVNDLLIAAWFVVGSMLFFSNSTATLGTWFFLAGSIELAIRPTIRLVRHVHLRRLQAVPESDQDF